MPEWENLWKNLVVVLEVEQDLALDLKKLAKKDDPKKTWNVKAREILYSYVAMHRARGAID